MTSESELNPDTSMWDWITDDLWFYAKKSDLSGAELARILNRDPSSVYNIMSGRRRIQDKDAKILDKRLGLNHHFGRLLRYAKFRSNSDWFGQYLEHEATAKVIKTYEALAIPGLPASASRVCGRTVRRRRSDQRRCPGQGTDAMPGDPEEEPSADAVDLDYRERDRLACGRRRAHAQAALSPARDDGEAQHRATRGASLCWGPRRLRWELPNHLGRFGRYRLH